MGKIVRREQYFEPELIMDAQALARRGLTPERYIDIYQEQAEARGPQVTKWIVWEETEEPASRKSA